MPDPLPIPLATQADVPSRFPTRKRAAWYAAGFVLLSAISFLLTLWATTQPWFLQHDAYPALAMMGYGQRAHGAACEVVLYGDSTALVGLNPAIIQARTGLKTCNIAEYRPIAEFVGVDFPLDDYLAHNPAPRVILTSWLAANFQLDRGPVSTHRTEGYLYALQFNRGPWLWKYLATHPADTIFFLAWAQSSMLTDAFDRLTDPQARTQAANELATRDRQSGMWAFNFAPQTACGIADAPSLSNHAQNAVGAAAFRKRYATNSTAVIVNVSPAASCDPSLKEYAELTAGLTDNKLEVLPISNFNTLNVHLDSAGSTHYSQEVSNQILVLLRQQTTGPSNPSKEEK